MFDWNNKLSKLLKLYFVKRWRSSFFHNWDVYQNCQTVLFWLILKILNWSRFQDFHRLTTKKPLMMEARNKCKQHLKLHLWRCCGYLCWCTYKSFLLLGWENDPLGCLLILLVALVASLGKACHFLKFCSKRNKFKVDGFLACVCRYRWLVD